MAPCVIRYPPHPAWIALVFGGDPFSIKSARAKLIEDGWFARLETPQRVRQRYGEWVVLIIEPPVENHDETEPPLQNQSLSDEIETNQSLHPGASQPTWENIQPLDLHTPKRSEQLYHAALAAGVISPSEPHRHTFCRHCSCHPSGNTERLWPLTTTR